MHRYDKKEDEDFLAFPSLLSYFSPHFFHEELMLGLNNGRVNEGKSPMLDGGPFCVQCRLSHPIANGKRQKEEKKKLLEVLDGTSCVHIYLSMQRITGQRFPSSPSRKKRGRTGLMNAPSCLCV